MFIKKYNIFKLIQALLFLVIAGLVFLSCRKEEEVSTDPSIRLHFSQDTVVFDTVFSTIGSITKQFTIRNTSDNKINISTIRLASGTRSNFQINVDGVAGTNIRDIEIGAHDSIYVFIKVTVDPTNQNTPLVVTDDIIFSINGNVQTVNLMAWGQDAHFHINTVYQCNATWTNDKPHVIIGFTVIDSLYTLTIDQGARVYMHNNAILAAAAKGSIKINGALNNPVTIQGDRLEMSYRNTPGQWGKIWLSAGSIDNTINYAIIKNGTIGIQVDTFANANPTLTITNSIIENMSAAGIFTQGAVVQATNCVIANCGQYALVLSIGGTYSFMHCTIGNYWNYSVRKESSLVLNNYYQDVDGRYHVRDITSAYFGNCIIYGNIEEEITIDKYPLGSSVLNYSFENCILRTKLNISAPEFTQCMQNTDPLFIDYPTNEYQLQSTSPAIGAGKNLGILYDIKGKSRKTPPDIGAYEYIP